jgi:hypothetical protein
MRSTSAKISGPPANICTRGTCFGPPSETGFTSHRARHERGGNVSFLKRPFGHDDLTMFRQCSLDGVIREVRLQRSEPSQFP